MRGSGARAARTDGARGAASVGGGDGATALALALTNHGVALGCTAADAHRAAGTAGLVRIRARATGGDPIDSAIVGRCKGAACVPIACAEGRVIFCDAPTYVAGTADLRAGASTARGDGALAAAAVGAGQGAAVARDTRAHRLIALGRATAHVPDATNAAALAGVTAATAVNDTIGVASVNECERAAVCAASGAQRGVALRATTAHVAVAAHQWARADTTRHAGSLSPAVVSLSDCAAIATQPFTERRVAFTNAVRAQIASEAHQYFGSVWSFARHCEAADRWLRVGRREANRHLRLALRRQREGLAALAAENRALGGQHDGAHLENCHPGIRNGELALSGGAKGYQPKVENRGSDRNSWGRTRDALPSTAQLEHHEQRQPDESIQEKLIYEQKSASTEGIESDYSKHLQI